MTDDATWEVLEYHQNGNVRHDAGCATVRDRVARLWVEGGADPDCQYQIVERLDDWSRPVPDREPDAVFDVATDRT